MGKFHFGLHQTADQFRIIHPSGHIDLFLAFLVAQESNPVLGDFHLGGLPLIHHAQEIGIADFMDFRLKEHGADDRIDNQDQQNGCNIIQSDTLGLFVGILVIHSSSSFLQGFCMLSYDYSTNHCEK